MRPGLELGEEAHVLDGDDGLVRKGFDESNLLVREGLHVTTPYRDSPECRLLPQQWHGQERSVADGRVLVAGGFTGYDYLDSVELYDPATGTWSETTSLFGARYYHTATLLLDGTVLVACGATEKLAYLESAELYDPASSIWLDTARPNFGRYYHTATLLRDGTVLLAGGDSPDGIVATAELYLP